MDSNELLKLGEFYKELRIARKVKQKDVAKINYQFLNYQNLNLAKLCFLLIRC